MNVTDIFFGTSISRSVSDSPTRPILAVRLLCTRYGRCVENGFKDEVNAHFLQSQDFDLLLKVAVLLISLVYPVCLL